MTAAGALDDLESCDAQVAASLLPLLSDPDAQVRISASCGVANTLSCCPEVFDELSPEAYRTVVSGLAAPWADVRVGCLRALESQAILGKVPLETVAPLVDDADSQVRAQARYTVGRMGRQSIAVLPQLRARTRDEDRQVRQAARDAVNWLEMLQRNPDTNVIEKPTDRRGPSHEPPAKPPVQLPNEGGPGTEFEPHVLGR